MTERKRKWQFLRNRYLVALIGSSLVIIIATWLFFISFRFDKYIISPLNSTTIDENNSLLSHQYFEKNIVPIVDRYLQAFKDRPIWKVNLSEAQNYLMQNDLIETASIFRHLPNQLEILVKPREIVCTFFNGGNLLPVTNDGRLISFHPHDQPKDLPILRGKGFNNREIRLKAISLLNDLPSAGLLSDKTVSEIIYTDKNGLELFLTNFPFRLILGEPPFAKKVERVGSVLEYFNGKSVPYSTLDARYANRVIVKK